MITKEFNGYCPSNECNNTINVTFKVATTTDVNNYVGQKGYFECENEKCEHFINQDCPIFKNVPCISEISNFERREIKNEM